MVSSPSSSSLNNTSPRGQPSPQVNRDHTTLANSLNRLAISSASPTSLPPSPASASRSREQRFPSSPDVSRTQRSPFNRSPSSMSIDPRSSTPTLLRKASMNSLHGVGGVTPSRSSSRRSSSAQLLAASPAPMSGSPLSGKGASLPAPPRHTATSIASAHFKTELELHENEEERPADTIVILHDSCYGHRYSRPRTSRAALSTIVERPERIHASILGLSVAYVRLGDRHGEGQYPLHPSQDASSIPTIPFRIRKTTRKLPLSSPAVTNVHGAKWMEELKIMCDGAEAKLAQNGKELTRPDMPRSPDQEAPSKFHEGDLYLCAESLDAMEGALGAVCEGVDAIFQGSATHKGPHRAFVAIRPPGHHCSASYPSGFCWLNNVHVGIAYAALTHGLTHAAIIDFDLHHGDGSQSITWDHNTRAKNSAKNAAAWKKTSIGYFSLHDINSYPCEMGDEDKVKNASLCLENAHGQSIWNVHLQPWKSEAEFWELYETKYIVLLEKARNYLRAQTERLRASSNLPKPKAVIFLSAGFDASEWESSGMQRHKVNVPTEFYARLTRDVVKIAAEEGSAVDGRVISVLEGGYSDRALCTGVFSHISGLAGGDPIAVKKEKDHTGLNYEMGQKIGMFDGILSPDKPVFPGTQPYDPNWWSLPKLEQLDAVMNPVAPSPEPKQPRNITPPTYSSPTQSFTAKIVDTQFRRSMSRSTSTMSVSNGSPRAVSRAPTPPPPEVHWTVASHELSKLLIPTDRQTYSCKPEDLSAEATRARRDRQSILMPVAEAPAVVSTSNTRMALRERKPAKPIFDSVEDDKPKANRRKTGVGAAVLAAEKAISRSTTPKPDLPITTQHTNQASRRLSVASNIGSVISDSTSSRPSSRVPSNGSSTIPKRPDTSQSIRPESSMSSRGSVVVKKTRAPAQPRGDAVKPSRARKKSPLGGSDAPQEPHSRPESAGLSNTDTVPSHNSDMDSLTAGFKKIKINLTTKAQREAREAKEAKEAKDQSKPIVKAPATKPLPKAAPKKPAKARQTEEQVQEAPEPAMQSAELQSNGPPFVPVTSPGPVADMLPQPSAPQPITTSSIPSGLEEREDTTQLPPTQIPSQVMSQAPLLESSPSDPDSSNRVPPSHIPSQVPLSISSPLDPVSSRFIPNHSTSGQSNTGVNTDIFVQYQPEGPPASAIPQSGESLRWLPPNTATPAATPGQTPVKRETMPIFTATSAIPFGTNPNPNGAPKNTENQESKPN